MKNFPKKLPDMPKGNWKAGLAFSPKTTAPGKPKPEKEKKQSPPKKNQPWSNEYPKDKEGDVIPFSKPKPTQKKKPKPLKRTPLKPPTKPIAKRGKKQQERIAAGGSETTMNLGIWNKRPHWCEQCGIAIAGALEPFIWITDAKGERVQKLIRPECFAHKLAKGMYPKHRLNPSNIALVCSMECHALIDKLYNDLALRKELDEELSII